MNHKKILYSLPDFYNYFQLNMLFRQLMQQRVGLFRENAVIDSMYGTFPGLIWNSGRGQMGASDLENIVGTINSLNEAGISVRLTATNGKLTPEQYKDTYGNAVLNALNQIGPQHGIQNGVNVAIDSFRDYIMDKYPNLYTIWSTTKGIKTVEQVNELSADTLTVVPYEINNTTAVDLLTHPSMVEFLCCESCIDNCPDRQAHYADISQHQAYLASSGFRCPHGCEVYNYYDNVPKRKHYISPETIESMYLPRNIDKFKISGRNDHIVNVIERYVTYFAKPEYRDEVRNLLLIAAMSGPPQPHQ